MKRYATAIIAAGLFLIPAVASPYGVRTATGCLLFLVLAHCFNLMGGHSGYLNLGQGVFVGFGAYACGWCLQSGVSLWAAVTVCGVSGLLAGLILGAVLFRLRGGAFALVNLALLFICLHLAMRLRGITGGADGFYLAGGGSLNAAFYGLAALAVCCTWIAGRLPETRFGVQVRVSGIDHVLAQSIGIAPRWLNIRLFAACGAGLTMAGAFFMLGQGYIIPATVFGLPLSLLPVAMAMVGGLGRPWGPVWGALAVYGVQEWLWLYVGSFEQSLLGVMLVAAGKRDAIGRRAAGWIRRRRSALPGPAG